jgi:hypothetical protein
MDRFGFNPTIWVGGIQMAVKAVVKKKKQAPRAVAKTKKSGARSAANMKSVDASAEGKFYMRWKKRGKDPKDWTYDDFKVTAGRIGNEWRVKGTVRSSRATGRIPIELTFSEGTKALTFKAETRTWRPPTAKYSAEYSADTLDIKFKENDTAPKSDDNIMKKSWLLITRP